MLPVLILHGDPVSRAQSFAVGLNLLVDRHYVESHEVTHGCVCAAFLGLLRRAAHPAEFVRIFAGILRDALVFERAEDVIRAVVFDEVVFVRLECRVVSRELVSCRIQPIPCVAHGLGFASVRWTRNDAVVYGPYP